MKNDYFKDNTLKVEDSDEIRVIQIQDHTILGIQEYKRVFGNLWRLEENGLASEETDERFLHIIGDYNLNREFFPTALRS